MKKGVNVVIINNQGKILILRRSSFEFCYPNLWDLPGGKLKDGETLQKAAKREAKEESGLDIKLEDNYFYIFRYPKENEKYAFKSTLTGGKVLLSEEHTEFKWISKDERHNFEFIPSVKATLEKFFRIKMGNININSPLENNGG